MIVLPARPEMADMIQVQPAQIGQVMKPAEVAAAIAAGPAYGVAYRGRLLALGGLSTIWPGRGYLWGLLASDLGPSMTPIHRVVARALAEADLQRVEAYIDPRHLAADRWIRLLGFEQEGVMRAFWQGQDFALYSLTR